MFNPEAMKAAQAQFAKMNPEQRAAMFAQMKNITPEMLRQSQEAMKNMKPSDFENMDLDGATNFQRQQQYLLNGAVSIKNEGNAFVKSENYISALEKYNLALEKLKPISHEGRKNEEIACRSNAAMCLLKLSRFSEALEFCEEILTENSKHVKALFRRGQAKRGSGNLKAALVDVTTAFELSPEDESIKKLMEELKAELVSLEGEDAVDEEKLKAMKEEEANRLATAAAEKAKKEQEERAREMAKMMGMDESTAKMVDQQMRQVTPEQFNQAASHMTVSATIKPQTGVKVEEVTDEDGVTIESVPQASSSTAASTTTAGNMGFPSIDPSMMTPEMSEKMMSIFSNSTPEEMATLMEMSTKMMGPNGPNLEAAQEMLTKNPALISKLAKGMFSNMSDTDMEDMASKMGVSADQLKTSKNMVEKIDEKTAARVMTFIAYALTMWQYAKKAKDVLVSQKGALMVLCFALFIALLQSWGLF